MAMAAGTAMTQTQGGQMIGREPGPPERRTNRADALVDAGTEPSVEHNNS